MDALLRIVLSNIAAAALIAAFAVLAAHLFRRPALAHALWLLVLLKLVTPPLFNVPLSFPRLASRADASNSAPYPVRQPTAAHEHVVSPVFITAEPLDAASPRVTAVRHNERQETARGVRGEVSLKFVIGTAWATGSAVCLLVVLHRLRRFRGVLCYATEAPPEVQARGRELSIRLGMRTVPAILLLPGKICPMLYAAGGAARLLLPENLWNRLTGPQRDAMLLHELAHLRRRDHWVRGLEVAVTVLYWWNPIAWWARHELREAEEHCCDAWVIWALPGAFRDYASALLEAVDFASESRTPLPALASGIGEFHHLRRRLLMIRQGNVPRMLSGSGFGGVCAFAALLLPLSATLAQQESKETPQETRAPSAGNNRAGEAKRDAVAPASPVGKSVKDDPTPGIGKAHINALAQLDRPLPEISFDGVALSDVIDFLRDVSGANIMVNWKGLEESGVDKNTPVTCRLRNVKFSKALESILMSAAGSKHKLGYEAEDDVITISTANDLSGRALTNQGYKISDLIDGDAKTRDKKLHALQTLIMGAIDPASWETKGGPGQILTTPSNGNVALTIKQTQQNHDAIENLLEGIRKLQDLAMLRER